MRAVVSRARLVPGIRGFAKRARSVPTGSTAQETLDELKEANSKMKGLLSQPPSKETVTGMKRLCERNTELLKMENFRQEEASAVKGVMSSKGVKVQKAEFPQSLTSSEIKIMALEKEVAQLKEATRNSQELANKIDKQEMKYSTMKMKMEYSQYMNALFIGSGLAVLVVMPLSIYKFRHDCVSYKGALESDLKKTSEQVKAELRNEFKGPGKTEPQAPMQESDELPAEEKKSSDGWFSWFHRLFSDT